VFGFPKASNLSFFNRIVTTVARKKTYEKIRSRQRTKNKRTGKGRTPRFSMSVG